MNHWVVINIKLWVKYSEEKTPKEVKNKEYWKLPAGKECKHVSQQKKSSPESVCSTALLLQILNKYMYNHMTAVYEALCLKRTWKQRTPMKHEGVLSCETHMSGNRRLFHTANDLWMSEVTERPDGKHTAVHVEGQRTDRLPGFESGVSVVTMKTRLSPRRKLLTTTIHSVTVKMWCKYEQIWQRTIWKLSDLQDVKLTAF